MADAPLDLGPCCACEREGPTVRNVLMLEKRAPVRGVGWGCVVCGLAPDGAVAVLCDRCLLEGRRPRLGCRGSPGTDGRIPIEQLTEDHRHEAARHPDAATWN